MINADLYRKWIEARGLIEAEATETKRGREVPVRLDLPDERGFFRRGTTPCVLPYIRVYWTADTSEEGTASSTPPWRPETWERLAGEPSNGAGKGDGYVRFFRSDQLLECVHDLCGCKADLDLLVAALRAALPTWLVPLDEPLRDCIEVLEQRVETVRLLHRDGRWLWSRNVRYFPDAVRVSVVDGIDPVHTPENARAGLTRYLCEGWRVGDDGRLAPDAGASGWGPSVGRVPYRLHDGPRRLMLGASLQTRGVALLESERPTAPDDTSGWLPPGRNLRASFTMLGGWTHEDAVVLSESAVRKLGRKTVRQLRVLVPSVATRVEILEPTGHPVAVRHNQVLARAFVDAYALGLRRGDAEACGAEDGWVEVALPNASALIDGELCRVARQVLRTPYWREMITFTIERVAPIRVGDKLSTRHGLKGVVSRIMPDAEMPSTPYGTAEIVFSPLGILRRGAMGQLREAAPPLATAIPRSGPIFVMRQPQDADVPERCRVRGPTRRGEHLHHGQRYGEMEFWALMAHGAPQIAKELLSVARSTASWMDWESKIEAGDHRQLATRALNRYLAISGVQVQHGRLVPVRKASGVFEIEPKWRGLGDPRDKLDDARFFCEQGGLGRMALGRSVRVDLGDADSTPLELDHIYVVPPWLRPSSPSERHELTRAYWRLMTRLAWPWSTNDEIERAVRTCVRLALHDSLGAGGFVRREVLGRRLTRSARAVIVPRPDLRIDQIALPEWMADRLVQGLPDSNRRLVLVNRNPTLHRRGLLALRPVIEPSNASHVFGVPLGILRAMGADFDGDQASVVVLETEAALAEAERLLPGASELRGDPFRSGRPAFPFAGELADAASEERLAGDTTSTQEAWCEAHRALQQASIDHLGDGWSHPLVTKAIADNDHLWAGVDESAWRRLATAEMEKVLRGVRRKGKLGGVLRHEFYRRGYTNAPAFWRSVQAIQAVTERMTQTALSVKSGAGATEFNAKKYFTDPSTGRELLSALDRSAGKESEPIDPDYVAEALGYPAESSGLLRWLTRLDAPTLLASSENAPTSEGDPRLTWFFS